MHEKVCTFLPVFVVSAAGSVDVVVVVVVVVVLMVTLMSIMPLSSSLSQNCLGFVTAYGNDAALLNFSL